MYNSLFNNLKTIIMIFRFNIVKAETELTFSNKEYTPVTVDFSIRNKSIEVYNSDTSVGTTFDVIDSNDNTKACDISTHVFNDIPNGVRLRTITVDIEDGEVWDFVDLEIAINDDAYTPYLNNFRIFGFDTGNNRNDNYLLAPLGDFPNYNSALPIAIADAEANYSFNADENCERILTGQNKPDVVAHNNDFVIVLYSLAIASLTEVIMQNPNMALLNTSIINHPNVKMTGTWYLHEVTGNYTLVAIESDNLVTIGDIIDSVTEDGITTYTFEIHTSTSDNHIYDGFQMQLNADILSDYITGTLFEVLPVIVTPPLSSNAISFVTTPLLVQNDLSLGVHSDFIAYRHPLFNVIYLFNNQGYVDTNQVNEYNVTSLLTGELVETLVASNGHFCIKEDVCITRTCNGKTSKRIVKGQLTSLNHYIEVVSDSDCTESCLVLETGIAYANMDIPSLSKFWKRDDIVTLFSDLEIEWKLQDFTGNVIETQTSTFASLTFTSGHYVINEYDREDYRFDFTIPAKGDYLVSYTIRATAMVNGVLTTILECSDNKLIQGGNKYLFLQNSCNEVVIKNLTASPMDVVIYTPNAQYEFDDAVTSIIEPLDNLINVFATDGIYKVVIDGDEYYYIATCKMNACLLQVIKDSICNCSNDKCEENIHYKANAIIIQYQTYLSLISHNNPTFNFNTDSIIRDIDSLQVSDISQIMERISDYCTICDDKFTNCSSC